MAKQLDRKQMMVLSEVSKLGGRWSVRSSWTFGTNLRTENVLASLIPRRLVERVGIEGGFGIYELTAEGRSMVQS